MIRFLVKGLLRDPSRSLFPMLTVFSGVALTVFLYCWIQGATTLMIQTTAKYGTGHLRVMSRAYAEESDLAPNDLSLTGTEQVINGLQANYPELYWTPRIKFGGLIDIPDEVGETRSQGPLNGLAVDLLNTGSPDRQILNIEKSIVRGTMPDQPGEMLLADAFATNLGVVPGETATLLSSTMYGSMSMQNFVVSGTVAFGVMAMDRGAMIADISDVRIAMDMTDGAGEIMGFFKDDVFDEGVSRRITDEFNARQVSNADQFAPIMSTLRDEPGVSDNLDQVSLSSAVIISIFVLAMSLVLWNAGLMGSLRRYGEIGVRLAIGEERGHIYWTMLAESMMIGFAGSALGTLAGVGFGYYMQVHGLDISDLMKNATVMFPDTIRARVTPNSFVIGFVPGLLATFLGTAIAGLGIYKRETAQLFKELEV